MPLEISYGAHVAMRLNPSDRRLRPLISPCAPETRIHSFGMGLKIVDQGDGYRDTLLLNHFSLGFAADQAAQVQNKRQSGDVCWIGWLVSITYVVG
jgi:hypothetical protein